MLTNENVAKWIFTYAASDKNTLAEIDEPAFGAPLVGFAAGDDAMFTAYKRDIGDFYCLPGEWMEAKYGRPFPDAALSVVSWVLPQTARTKQYQAQERAYPAGRWAMCRTFGEAFQRQMALDLERWLDAQGIAAVAPIANSGFRRVDSPKYVFASNWSERHTAHICGLGTFGLCDGLITPLGKAVRCGSLIVNAALTPTPRPYTRYNEYCLADRGCNACIARCPAHALSPAGHDKRKCEAYCQQTVAPYIRERYGFEGIYGCGLCQADVPCESAIPRRAAANARE